MRTETKWAIIATVVLFIWMFIEKLAGLQTAEKFGAWAIVDLIAKLVMWVVIFLLFLREKRDGDFGGSMSWKQGFWSAAVMSLVFIPLGAMAVYLFLCCVNPNFAQVFGDKVNDGKSGMNDYLFATARYGVFRGLLFSLIFPLLTRRSA